MRLSEVNEARQLFDLQELDLEIERRKEALATVESQIGEREALRQAKARLEEERHKLQELRKKLKDAEWEVEDTETKLRQVKEKLYGGKVRNPRELTSLQEEEKILQARLSQGEDKALELMSQGELAEQHLTSLRKELAAMEEEWQQKQKELSAQQAELKSTLEDLAGRRDSLRPSLTPSSLELYQSLRPTKQGKAVARVEQGRCQGCRLSLSVTDMRRVRAGNEMVQCSSCGRILF